MPRVPRDNQLLERATRFVQASGGCRNAAAGRLGINRVTFWRFMRSGSALARTRMHISKALDGFESETNGTKIAGVPDHLGDAAGPLSELQGIREMCLRMLAWVDVMEPRVLAASKQHKGKRGVMG